MIVIPTDVYILIFNYSGNAMCGPLRRERIRAGLDDPLIRPNTMSFYPSGDVGFMWRINFPKYNPFAKNYYCLQCGNIRRRRGYHLSECGCPK